MTLDMTKTVPPCKSVVSRFRYQRALLTRLDVPTDVDIKLHGMFLQVQAGMDGDVGFQLGDQRPRLAGAIQLTAWQNSIDE